MLKITDKIEKFLKEASPEYQKQAEAYARFAGAIKAVMIRDKVMHFEVKELKSKIQKAIDILDSETK